MEATLTCFVLASKPLLRKPLMHFIVLKSVIFYSFNCSFVHSFFCVHTQQDTGRGQRATSALSFPMWIPGIKFRLSLVASAIFFNLLRPVGDLDSMHFKRYKEASKVTFKNTYIVKMCVVQINLDQRFRLCQVMTLKIFQPHTVHIFCIQ